MTFDELIAAKTPQEVMAYLKQKIISVPKWTGHKGLIAEYDSEKHPVMNKGLYPDIITDDGIEHVTRITCDLQRLATKRMTELCVGIPPKRIYRPQNTQQQEIAGWLEKIYDRVRINSINVERLNMLFACCEVMTLWYAVEERNNLYGFDSPLKLRVRNFSPMLGDDLYPLFDEYGDMIAMSVAYTRKVANKSVNFFDAYTKDRHVKFSDMNGEWEIVEDEQITLLKIPAIYMWRPRPIWESMSKTVYEIEWALSRNGNYLRKNSKPLFIVFADKVIQYGDEKSENKEFKSVMQYPKGASAAYVTWEQAIENLKFYVNELRSQFFTQLQLPDWSYEKMSQQALSGESRKQLFIDAQMKVKDESGRLEEGFDREVNVVKSFLKVMTGGTYNADIDALPVENKITPFSIRDDQEDVNRLVSANGGKPIMSQRESIEEYGHSDNVDKTLQEIANESTQDVFEPTL